MERLTLLELGQRAWAERERRHGQRVYFSLSPVGFDLIECAPDGLEAALDGYRGSSRAVALAIAGDPGQTTGEAELRLIALARLRLPQVEHIVALYDRLSPYIAQVALRFGADQLAGFPPGLPRKEIERVIREAALEPFECDENYQPFTSAESGLTVLYS